MCRGPDAGTESPHAAATPMIARVLKWAARCPAVGILSVLVLAVVFSSVLALFFCLVLVGLVFQRREGGGAASVTTLKEEAQPWSQLPLQAPLVVSDSSANLQPLTAVSSTAMCVSRTAHRRPDISLRRADGSFLGKAVAFGQGCR